MKQRNLAFAPHSDIELCEILQIGNRRFFGADASDNDYCRWIFLFDFFCDNTRTNPLIQIYLQPEIQNFVEIVFIYDFIQQIFELLSILMHMFIPKIRRHIDILRFDSLQQNFQSIICTSVFMFDRQIIVVQQQMFGSFICQSTVTPHKFVLELPQIKVPIFDADIVSEILEIGF